MTDTKPASVKLGGTLYQTTAVLKMAFPDTVDSDNPKYTGWDLVIAGPGHPRTIEINNRIAERANKQASDRDRARVNGKKWNPPAPSPDDVRRETVSDACYRIVGWTGDPDFEDGKGPIAYSEEAAVELFMDQRKGSYFLQLIKFLYDDGTFMPASAKT